jgi:hypothetical protein
MEKEKRNLAKQRRSSWCIDYWTNAGTSSDYFDPLSVVMVPDPRGFDPENPRVKLPDVPMSLYGWIEECENPRDPPEERRMRVVPAKEVYRVGADPLAS